MPQAKPSRMFLSAPHMSGEEKSLVEEVFASNWVAPTGPMVTRFEDDLATLTGIGNVAALSSGTAALHLALRLSGIEQGDEVWCATMTFIGGVSPILYLGAKPVFLDVEPDAFLLDLDLLQSELETARQRGALPKVVVTTDLYGHVIDQGRMRMLAESFEFVWISDSAEAVGAYRNREHAGKGAHFTVLSFNGNKIITTSGGGALASDDAGMIEQARYLSTQAREPAPHYEHVTHGYNYRLSNICAAIGVGQLRVLRDRVRARRRINTAYRQCLADVPGIVFSNEVEGMVASRWLTTVLIDPAAAGFDRETVRHALEAENIESRPFWKPMHLQPLFADARYLGGVVAARSFDLGLCLPSGSAMTDEDVARVVQVIRSLAGLK